MIDALDLWKAAVPFVFSEVPAGGVLSIASVAPVHGDGFDFTLRHPELAHAFGPATGGGQFDGQVHLNSSRTWANGNSADADVLTIVLHELGHALGIVDHISHRPDAVMNGDFPRGLVRRTLTDADVHAIRLAYADVLS